LLADLAAAFRGRRRRRLRYRGRDGGGGVTGREVEPHRLAHTPRRWYLLAWDVGKDDWRTFRVDRIEGPLGLPGARFTPRPLPQDDVAAYVSRSITSAPYRYRARILFHAPLASVAPRTSPGAGRLEAVDERTCLFLAGSDSLDDLAVYVATKGFDFEVLEPAELVPVLRALSGRLARAAGTGER
ncbi:WYL domain-containing protein, partial [Nonomuraea maheshkhaliensis]|uniref:helix-turn-helix transcriptional regulator n=1 Tax=Nonomuraea maheshkhaliensis TaxID=419590 RepID=UPI0031F82456